MAVAKAPQRGFCAKDRREDTMTAFPIWLPLAIGTVNLVIASASLVMVRKARRYAAMADASRREAEASLAKVLALHAEIP